MASNAPTTDALSGVVAAGVTSSGTWDPKTANLTEGYVQTLQVQSTNLRASSFQSSSLVGGNVYNALFNAALTMEARLAESLETYQKYPDVQANLQQLQYDLQQWNLTLTTMSNINKNLGDALKSIASNFR